MDGKIYTEGQAALRRKGIGPLIFHVVLINICYKKSVWVGRGSMPPLLDIVKTALVTDMTR